MLIIRGYSSTFNNVVKQRKNLAKGDANAKNLPHAVTLDLHKSHLKSKTSLCDLWNPTWFFCRPEPGQIPDKSPAF